MKINFNIERLQELLSAFYELNKLTISCFDSDLNCIAYAGGWEEYCMAVTEKKEFWGKCELCNRDHANIARERETIYIYSCYAKLAEAVIPIFMDGRPLAYLMIGKFRDEEQVYSSGEKILAFAEENGLDKEKMLEAYRKLPVLNKRSIRALGFILKALVHYVCNEKCIRVSRDEIADEIDSFITENLNKKITIEMLCKTFHCSRYALYDIFKINFDEKPLDYIDKKRLQKAIALLSTTEESVASISEKIGFTNFGYFSQWFKSQSGISPLKFRKEHKES